MHKFRGVIFDFNGVLVWDSELHHKVFNGISVELRGKPFTKDEFKKLDGRTNRYFFEFLLGKHIDKKSLEKWIYKKESRYQRLADSIGNQYKLSPGAEELLDELVKQNIPHTIGTSSPKMNVDFFNKKFSLEKWFDISKIVYDDGNLAGKPAPDIYIKSAKAIGLSPSDCVIIEDAEAGIMAAAEAGIGKIIALAPEKKHEDFKKLNGVRKIITRLKEISIEELLN